MKCYLETIQWITINSAGIEFDEEYFKRLEVTKKIK